MRGTITDEHLTEEAPTADAGRETKTNQRRGTNVFDSEFDESEPPDEVDELLSDYAPVTRGEVTATLADELRSGSVPEPALADLREFGMLIPVDDRPSVPGRFEVRLERMQTDLSKISAYTEAIEAFVDEEGSGRRLLAEFRETVAELEARHAEAATTLERLQAEQREFETRLSEIEYQDDELAGLHASVGAVESTVEAVTGATEKNEEAIRRLRAEVAENRQAIQELCDVQDRILRAFSGAVDDESE